MIRANDQPEPCDHNVKAAFDRTLDPPCEPYEEDSEAWSDMADWMEDLARELGMNDE